MFKDCLQNFTRFTFSIPFLFWKVMGRSRFPQSVAQESVTECWFQYIGPEMTKWIVSSSGVKHLFPPMRWPHTRSSVADIIIHFHMSGATITIYIRRLPLHTGGSRSYSNIEFSVCSYIYYFRTIIILVITVLLNFS